MNSSINASADSHRPSPKQTELPEEGRGLCLHFLFFCFFPMYSTCLWYFTRYLRNRP